MAICPVKLGRMAVSPSKPQDFRVAICTFAVTPGLSPVLPRLAQGIGEAAATEYYRLAVECSREAMKRAAAIEPKNVPFWAVAEARGSTDPLWKDFGSFHSGEIAEDGLRYAHVHAQARKSGYNGAVFVVAGETPQLSGEEVAQAAQFLRAYEKKKRLVVGLSHDGGAYLVAFPTRLDPETWKKIPYGSDNVAEGLVRAIEEQDFEIITFEGKSTVEAPGDLKLLQDKLKTMARTPGQDRLLEWLKRH